MESNMALLDELKKNREKILALAEQCGLKDVRVFGSVARGEDRSDSDIDILAEYIPSSHAGLKVFRFPREIEQMFGHKVDLVFESGLYHVVRDRILNEAKPL